VTSANDQDTATCTITHNLSTAGPPLIVTADTPVRARSFSSSAQLTWTSCFWICTACTGCSSGRAAAPATQALGASRSDEFRDLAHGSVLPHLPTDVKATMVAATRRSHVRYHCHTQLSFAVVVIQCHSLHAGRDNANARSTPLFPSSQCQQLRSHHVSQHRDISSSRWLLGAGGGCRSYQQTSLAALTHPPASVADYAEHQSRLNSITSQRNQGNCVRRAEPLRPRPTPPLSHRHLHNHSSCRCH